MPARHILVGVDESHNDSKDAIYSSMSFITKENGGVLDLVSVFGKGTASADLKKRLLRAYEDDIRGAPVQVGIRPVIDENEDVAAAILKEVHTTKADLLAIGAGAVKSFGSLGSVALKIIMGSQIDVLIAKRHAASFVPGAPREFLAAVDGSTASSKGFAKLLSLCNPGDKVKVVVISSHSYDDSILDNIISTNADTMAKLHVTATKERVDPKSRTAGEVLCDIVSPEIHALVVGSANSSAKALGSTTKYCLSHCPISILVLKVFIAV